MVPNDENRRFKFSQKPPPLIDIIEIIVCCVGIIFVVQSACTQARKVISIPKVDHFIRSILLPE